MVSDVTNGICYNITQMGSKEYSNIHKWMYRHYGRAHKCENCHAEKAKRYEWANLSGEYKKDRSDWKQLCKQCHVNMDRPPQIACVRGHIYELGSFEIYYDKKKGYKSRRCLVCRVENKQAWLQRRREAHQGRYRTTDRIIEWNGQRKNLTEWAQWSGISRITIADRIARGWDVGRSLTERPR
jgi:hypothetical protein